MNSKTDADNKSISKEIFFPNDEIGVSGKIGDGVFKKEDKICSALVGTAKQSGSYISVSAMKGRYYPKVGDVVIATCSGIGPSHWYMDINSSSDALLHFSETEWKVGIGETSKFMGIGDACIAEIFFSGTGSYQVSFKKGFIGRRLYAGTIFKIECRNVSKIIGKQGANIEMIREKTNTRIQIGQNGMIWVDGTTDEIAKAMGAIKMINEEEGKIEGTEMIEKFLKGDK
tara:strand:- start:4292 stop:4978 length:687 start_codon:yes stop_codon:yes gene_type:complete